MIIVWFAISQFVNKSFDTLQNKKPSSELNPMKA